MTDANIFGLCAHKQSARFLIDAGRLRYKQERGSDTHAINPERQDLSNVFGSAKPALRGNPRRRTGTVAALETELLAALDADAFAALPPASQEAANFAIIERVVSKSSLRFSTNSRTTSSNNFLDSKNA